MSGKVMATMFALMAELERDLISIRTKEALAARKKAGVILGRPKGPGKSKLDPYEASFKRLAGSTVARNMLPLTRNEKSSINFYLILPKASSTLLSSVTPWGLRV